MTKKKRVAAAPELLRVLRDLVGRVDNTPIEDDHVYPPPFGREEDCICPYSWRKTSPRNHCERCEREYERRRVAKRAKAAPELLRVLRDLVERVDNTPIEVKRAAAMSERAKRKYDPKVARIAGNILSGYVNDVPGENIQEAVKWCVAAARAIVAEVERTEVKDGD